MMSCEGSGGRGSETTAGCRCGTTGALLLKLLTCLRNCSHSLRRPDESFGGFVVEKVEVLEVVIFGAFEHIERDAIWLAGFFVDSVEKIEEQAQPTEDNVKFRLAQRLLWRGFVAKWRHQQRLDCGKHFFPYTCHYCNHGG